MQSREQREDMVFELESLRKSYRYFKNTKGIEGRIKHLMTLKKLGEELKAKLADLPEIPTLFELRAQDEDELLRVLSLMVVNVIEFHDTSKIMSPTMIQEVSLRIAMKHGGLTLEDVGLCFHQVKNGERGKIYNRLDAAVMLEWLNDYDKDIQEIGAERQRRVHASGKGSSSKSYTDHRLVVPARLRKLM